MFLIQGMVSISLESLDSSGEDRKGTRRNEVGREGLIGYCEEEIRRDGGKGQR